MLNKTSKGFLLNTKFYKSANNYTLLGREKQKPEGKGSNQPEGTAAKKQENTTAKQITMRKIHANELHTKLGHNGE